MRYVPARCGVLFLDKQRILQIANMEDKSLCKRELSLIEDDWLLDKIQSADHVLLASAWQERHLNVMNESLARLRSYTGASILVFGSKRLPKLKKRHIAYLSEERAALLASLSGQLSIQEKMLSSYIKESFVDIQAHICGTEGLNYDDCKLFDSQGNPKSYDSSHLTKHGAIFFGRSIEGFLKCYLLKECGAINTVID